MYRDSSTRAIIRTCVFPVSFSPCHLASPPPFLHARMHVNHLHLCLDVRSGKLRHRRHFRVSILFLHAAAAAACLGSTRQNIRTYALYPIHGLSASSLCLSLLLLQGHAMRVSRTLASSLNCAWHHCIATSIHEIDYTYAFMRLVLICMTVVRAFSIWKFM